MKTGKIIITLLIMAFALPQVAEGIPAFARKYRMSCKTCHSPIPRLKAYGDSFAGNGFKLEDQEAPRYFMETGDGLLSLIRDFPIAVRMDGHIGYDFYTKDEEGLSDMKTPYAIKLLSGGEISDKLAYYFYFYLFEYGEIAGVEDAYLMYNDLFNIDLDIYLGQFQVSDPLFKRELRLTLEDYYIYTVSPGLSDISLKYDKGIMVTFGTDFGTTIVAEVINGNGIGEAENSWQFDKDRYKNVMGRISQSISDYLRVGAFIYSGKEELVGSSDMDRTNQVLLWGPDISLNINDIVILNGQYLFRSDSRVIYSEEETEPMDDVKTNGGFAELILMPKGDESRWYFTGLFNYAESDAPGYDYRSASVHAGYLLRRNVRLVSEVTYNFTEKNREFWRGSLGFVAAF